MKNLYGSVIIFGDGEDAQSPDNISSLLDTMPMETILQTLKAFYLSTLV